MFLKLGVSSLNFKLDFGEMKRDFLKLPAICVGVKSEEPVVGVNKSEITG